ncbi:IS630 family transposase [Streptomyces sp. DASNCL29]|nr:IS630 family transposase [Streptomyces sp. DASNCL29]
MSVAGLIAWRPGSRTRLCHRLLTHPAGKGTRRSISERDYIALLDGVHQLVKAPIVLVWDRLNTHVSKTMQELIAEREWLTVFLLPAYSPDLNPVEGVWAHVKRSLANLAVVALDLKGVNIPIRLLSWVFPVDGEAGVAWCGIR